MEPVWPRAALEQKMKRARQTFLPLIAGGAFLAPLYLFGHACEFLVARLDLREREVALEITADYGGNPMIADESAAREAVARILHVERGGGKVALADLAPLHLEQRSKWDPEAPASFSPPPEGEQHKLITARWSWQPPDLEPLRLVVPERSVHDVLVWTRDQEIPGKQARWMLLIAGEGTPALRLPQAASLPLPEPGPPWPWPWRLGVALTAAILLTNAWKSWRFARRQRTTSQA